VESQSFSRLWVESAIAAMFGFHIESYENEAFGVQIAIQSNAQISV
jgi:hypothetical protein